MSATSAGMYRLQLIALTLMLAAASAQGQSAWAYADVYYDAATDRVIADTTTLVDYSTEYYYSPKVQVNLSGSDGSFTYWYCPYAGAGACTNGGYAFGYVSANATPGVTYTVQGYHTVEIYYYYHDVDPGCMWGCSEWYDALGYSTGPCTVLCLLDPNCFCVEGVGAPYNRSYLPPWLVHLVLVASQVLGDTSKQLDSPVPTLQVLNSGTPIAQGQTVYLTRGNSSSPPQMPALSASLIGAALTGTTTWRIRTNYTGHGRTDLDYFPGEAGRVQSSASAWDIRSDFGSALRGGSATLYYRYNTQPERSFGFQIRGSNPTEVTVKSKLGSSPWFLTRLVRQESSYLQFISGGEPYFGPPNGWGLMQTDPPDGPQQIWSWWANVDQGVQKLNVHNGVLTSVWNNRVTEWNAWNQQHPPEQQVGPPANRSEGGCVLQWVSGGDGSAANPSFRDACWMKRYNGLGVEGRDFLVWRNTSPYQDDPFWEVNEFATRSDGVRSYYVRDVCNKAP